MVPSEAGSTPCKTPWVARAARAEAKLTLRGNFVFNRSSVDTEQGPTAPKQGYGAGLERNFGRIGAGLWRRLSAVAADAQDGGFERDQVLLGLTLA